MENNTQQDGQQEDFESSFKASLSAVPVGGAPTKKRKINKSRVLLLFGFLAIIAIVVVCVLLIPKAVNNKKSAHGVTNTFNKYANYMLTGEEKDEDPKTLLDENISAKVKNILNSNDIEKSEKYEYYRKLSVFFTDFLNDEKTDLSKIDIMFEDEEKKLEDKASDKKDSDDKNEDETPNTVENIASNVRDSLAFLRYYMQISDIESEELLRIYAEDGLQGAKEKIANSFKLMTGSENTMAKTYANVKIDSMTTQLEIIAKYLPTSCISGGKVTTSCEKNMNKIAVEDTETMDEAQEHIRLVETLPDKAANDVLKGTVTLYMAMRGDKV